MIRNLSKILDDQKQELLENVARGLLPREGQKDLQALMKKPWVKVVQGIRRCGKSTLAQLAVNDDFDNTIYINFDDERLLSITALDLEPLLQVALKRVPNPKFLFFDEIQNIKGWELFVNRLLRKRFNILITGSNANLLSKELATHLTGRVETLELFPFSVRELIDTRQLTLEQALKQYFESGGFPEMVLQGYSPGYLRELYDKIISKDVVGRHQIKYVKTLKEIALFCISNVGQRISFNKIRNVFGIKSVHTVKNYFNYLCDTYLIFELRCYSHKVSERLTKARKVYAIDLGLINSLSGEKQNKGAELENAVFLELRRKNIELYFYFETSFEVDFVIRKGRRIDEIIQVCFSLKNPETFKREINALVKGAKALKCHKASIITWELFETSGVNKDLLNKFSRDIDLQIMTFGQWIQKKPG